MWPREKCRTSHAFFLLSFGEQLKSPRRYKVTCTHTAVTTSVCTAFPKKKNLTENDNQSEVACDLHAVVWVSMSARSSVTHTHAFGYQRRRRRRPYTVVVVVRVSGEGRNREGFLNSLLKRSRSACGQQNKTFRFFWVFFFFFSVRVCVTLACLCEGQTKDTALELFFLFFFFLFLDAPTNKTPRTNGHHFLPWKVSDPNAIIKKNLTEKKIKRQMSLFCYFLYIIFSWHPDPKS